MTLRECSKSAGAKTQSELASEIMTEALLKPHARCRQIVNWLKVRSQPPCEL